MNSMVVNVGSSAAQRQRRRREHIADGQIWLAFWTDEDQLIRLLLAAGPEYLTRAMSDDPEAICRGAAKFLADTAKAVTRDSVDWRSVI